MGTDHPAHDIPRRFRAPPLMRATGAEFAAGRLPEYYQATTQFAAMGLTEAQALPVRVPALIIPVNDSVHASTSAPSPSSCVVAE